jgi:SAM-dependent methyltransferase
MKLVELLDTVERVFCGECGCIYIAQDNYKKPVYDYDYNRQFHRAGDIRKAGIIAAQIREMITDKIKYPEILEVAPGNGLTAWLLDKIGCRVDCVDISAQNAGYIENELKINCENGKIEDMDILPQYDLIYAGHCIEHMPEPMLFMEASRKILKQGGLFFIETPALEFQGWHANDWKHFKTRDKFEHCTLFCERTFSLAAFKLNMKIKKISLLQAYESMQVILEKK